MIPTPTFQRASSHLFGTLIMNTKAGAYLFTNSSWMDCKRRRK